MDFGNYFGVQLGTRNTDQEVGFSQHSVYESLFDKKPYVTDHAATIPFRKVLDKMMLHSEPLYAQFIETSENLPFLRVAAKFFELTFWHEHIYVWYNKEEEKFYLLKKVKEDDKTDKRFIDLLSEHCLKILEIPILDEVIKHTWDGKQNNRFARWYHLCFHYIHKMMIYHSKCALYGKTLKRYVCNKNRDGLAMDEQALYDGSPILDVKSGAGSTKGVVNDYQVLDIVDQQQLQLYMKTLDSWFQKETDYLGLVANINPQGARNTTGENFLDTFAVVCRQQLELTQLKLFAAELKEKHAVDLSFEIIQLHQPEQIQEEQPKGPEDHDASRE